MPAPDPRCPKGVPAAVHARSAEPQGPRSRVGPRVCMQHHAVCAAAPGVSVQTAGAKVRPVADVLRMGRCAAEAVVGRP